MWASETYLTVTVMPLLSPMTLKMAFRTPIASAGVMSIMILVVVDELLTMTVAGTPMNRKTTEDKLLQGFHVKTPCRIT